MSHFQHFYHNSWTRKENQKAELLRTIHAIVATSLVFYYIVSHYSSQSASGRNQSMTITYLKVHGFRGSFSTAVTLKEFREVHFQTLRSDPKLQAHESHVSISLFEEYFSTGQ